MDFAFRGLRESAIFDRATIHAIQRAAATGVYDIRGWGAKRPSRTSTTCSSSAPACPLSA